MAKRKTEHTETEPETTEAQAPVEDPPPPLLEPEPVAELIPAGAPVPLDVAVLRMQALAAEHYSIRLSAALETLGKVWPKGERCLVCGMDPGQGHRQGCAYACATGV